MNDGRGDLIERADVISVVKWHIDPICHQVEWIRRIYWNQSSTPSSQYGAFIVVSHKNRRWHFTMWI